MSGTGSGGKNHGGVPPRSGREAGHTHATGEARAGVGAIPNRVLTFPSREEPRPPPLPTPPELNAPSSVRLTRDGAVIAGSAPPSLTELVAYTAQLADLVGDLLGAGPLAAVELSLADGACVIARASNGDLLAARAARGVDPMVLRQALLQADR
jgi:hypothetical protein